MRSLGWLALTLVAALFTQVRAQQDPLYTMYMWNTLAVNPGYAGSSDLLTATGLARQQWVGLAGAPSTQTLTVHSPLPMESLGVGLSVVQDQVGPVNNTLAFVDIAYRIRVTEQARLAFGVKAGVDLMQLKLGGLQNVDVNDPLFAADFSAKARPNFGVGLHYWNERGYLGLSAPKLLEHERFSTDAASTLVSTVRQRRHYFLTGGYVFDLGADVKFRPSFLVRAVEGAPLSTDLSAMFLLREKLWLGGAFRNEDAISAMVAYQVTDQFKVGYAHDFTTSELRGHHSGTHELMVSYDLRFNKERTLSPRYF